MRVQQFLIFLKVWLKLDRHNSSSLAAQYVPAFYLPILKANTPCRLHRRSMNDLRIWIFQDAEILYSFYASMFLDKRGPTKPSVKLSGKCNNKANTRSFSLQIICFYFLFHKIPQAPVFL